MFRCRCPDNHCIKKMSGQSDIVKEKAVPAIVVKIKKERKRKEVTPKAVPCNAVVSENAPNKKPRKYVAAKNLRTAKKEKDNPLNKLQSISPAPNNDLDNEQLKQQDKRDINELANMIMILKTIKNRLKDMESETQPTPTIQEHKAIEGEDEYNVFINDEYKGVINDNMFWW